jgi:hypothetical protein
MARCMCCMKSEQKDVDERIHSTERVQVSEYSNMSLSREHKKISFIKSDEDRVTVYVALFVTLSYNTK